MFSHKLAADAKTAMAFHQRAGRNLLLQHARTAACVSKSPINFRARQRRRFLGTVASDQRRTSVAIVGAGPAGLYTAEALLDASNNSGGNASGPQFNIHIIEKLLAPFGLARSGVAPDHPEISDGVVRKWTRMLSDRAPEQEAKTGEKNSSTVQFWGGVRVGGNSWAPNGEFDVTLSELRERFDAVVIATGSPIDRVLEIPGEDLPEVFGAADIVGWYNGHPDFQKHQERIRHALTRESSGHAVVVGAGNVALDVARMLLKSPEELATTDMTTPAVDILRQSAVQHVHLVARRGVLQSSFSMKELREILGLPGVTNFVLARDLELSKASKLEMESARGKSRMYKLFQDKTVQLSAWEDIPKGTTKSLRFHFCLSPLEAHGHDSLSRLICQQNRLVGEAGSQHPVGTTDRVTLPSQVIVRSIGFKGERMHGLPMDHKGVVPYSPRGVDGKPRLYVAGWIARGPSGVIATNRFDGREVASAIQNDFLNSNDHQKPVEPGLEALLTSRSVGTVDFRDWEVINSAEQENGLMRGKPREKFLHNQDMLNVARRSKDAGNRRIHDLTISVRSS